MLKLLIKVDVQYIHRLLETQIKDEGNDEVKLFYSKAGFLQQLDTGYPYLQQPDTGYLVYP